LADHRIDATDVNLSLKMYHIGSVEQCYCPFSLLFFFWSLDSSFTWIGQQPLRRVRHRLRRVSHAVSHPNGAGADNVSLRAASAACQNHSVAARRSRNVLFAK
jgi:hypothetical protein